MKLLDRLVVVARHRRLADATVDAYSFWIRTYLSFAASQRGEWIPPEQLNTPDVEAFLNHLVVEKRLSASSQNQALNALVFLYKQVLADRVQISMAQLACV
jgi:site-specific recombinase XerD